MESTPKHSSADHDVINRMLGSAAVKPLPPTIEVHVASASASAPAKPKPAASHSEPDFTKMTPAEKVAWNLARWKRVLG
ncbi:hypothetical protein ACERK3_15940 [Phycisphaerales bacterium AB-hyl4]|uniref:Uncharacterized protein n=1 Tax=Natronomicrosphaera hydrolytica TaxID=3242702 RepID=A0ABV4U9T8_9BACT